MDKTGDPVKYLIDLLQNTLLNENTEESHNKLLRLIRFNKGNCEHGDVCFPVSIQIWVNIFKNRKIPNIVGICNESDVSKDFLNSLENEYIPFNNISIKNNLCCLNLNRQILTKFLINSICHDNFKIVLSAEHQYKVEKFNCFESEDNISIFRANIVRSVLNNILEYADYVNVKSERQVYVYSVLQDSRKKSTDSSIYLKCGLVVNSGNKCVCQIKFKDYLKFKTETTQLIAMHKYGLRIKDSIIFKNLTADLGNASAIIDILEVKYSSPLQINMNCMGETRSSSFILYNSARLEVLLNKFEEKCKDGIYPPLKNSNEIDMSLLKEEEEWNLLYGYVFTYNNMLQRCIIDLDKGYFPIHKIIQFLNGLASTFSVYYRRIRILLEPRESLHEVIFARIYLLKCIQKVMNSCLAILNIKPVQYM